MIVTRIPFEPPHLRALELQDAQSWFGQMLDDPSYGEALVQGGPAYTVVADGRIITCAGATHIWPGRASVWALMADEIGGGVFLKLHRIVQRFLWVECDVKRVEAYVDKDFAKGHRWVRTLGFQYEGLMREFGAHGGDMAMWSRIR